MDMDEYGWMWMGGGVGFSKEGEANCKSQSRRQLSAATCARRCNHLGSTTKPYSPPTLPPPPPLATQTHLAVAQRWVVEREGGQQPPQRRLQRLVHPGVARERPAGGVM